MKYSPHVAKLKRELREVNSQIREAAKSGFCHRCMSVDVFWYRDGGGRRWLLNKRTEIVHYQTCSKAKPSDDAFEEVKEDGHQ